MNEVDKKLGRVGLSLKKEYNDKTTYKRLDVVNDRMGSYISLQDNNVGNPLSDPKWWMPQSNSQPLLDAENKALAAAKKAEDAAAKAEGTDTGIANAETLRVTAETERTNAENLRVASEKRRSDAEVLRKQDEDVRKTNETSRMQSEEGRASEELKRSNAESLRTTAEQGRATVEDTRKASETSREAAEQGRVAAETNRVKAEQSRVHAEDGRASAESNRVTAETSRTTEENNRAKAEQARATAEGERAKAEQARVTAEQNRVTEFNQSKQSADTAAAKANDAAKIANDAAANATTATDNMQKYVTEYNVSRLYPTKGIGGTDKYDLLTAIAALNADPTVDKSVGIKCSFVTSEGLCETYEFKGGAFNDVKSWAVYGTGSSNIKGVISHIQNWAPGYSSYTISNVVRGYIPQANHDLFISAGANFNTSTGYYELNGLTDISYEDMCAIYNETNHLRYEHNLNSAGNSSKARTNLPFVISTHYSPGYNLTSLFFQSRIEVFKCNYPMRANICVAMFYECSRLRCVPTYIDMTYAKDILEGAACIFNRCRVLKSVKLKGVNTNLILGECNSLDAESIGYMITNASDKSPISITLHKDAYTRAMSDAGVQAALAAKPNVSLASA